jgi:hypothetical protein
LPAVMLLTDQQTSLRTAFFGCTISLLKACKAPQSIASCVS